MVYSCGAVAAVPRSLLLWSTGAILFVRNFFKMNTFDITLKLVGNESSITFSHASKMCEHSQPRAFLKDVL